MLRNPRGATSLRWLRELLRAGIEVHAQVVVCPGVNDGARARAHAARRHLALPRTHDGRARAGRRQRLLLEETMRPHYADEARAVSSSSPNDSKTLTHEVLGRVSVFASDEFYLVAGQTPPSATKFESLDQAENGIGLVAAFVQSFVDQTYMDKLGTGFFQSVDGAPGTGLPRAARWTDDACATVTTCSWSPASTPHRYCAHCSTTTASTTCAILAVENRYFGGNIKVAGLLTGQDLINALARRGARDRVSPARRLPLRRTIPRRAYT